MYEHPVFCLASQVMDLTIREYPPLLPNTSILPMLSLCLISEHRNNTGVLLLRCAW